MKLKTYPNGDVYFGQMKENHMDGLGAILRPNVYLYFGKIKNKQAAGSGCFITNN